MEVRHLEFLGLQYTFHYSSRDMIATLEADKLQCILVLQAIPAWSG